MSRFRVLVVDDEENVRRILYLALREKYEVLEAHDGLDTLQKLEQVQPDFIILDVMMPLMDGFEACRAIRNHPGFRDTPILFLSAKVDKEALKEGYGAGANLYVTKPFDPAHLAANVDYFLEESASAPRPKSYTLEQLNAMGSSEAPVPVDAVVPPEKRGARLPRVMIVDGDAALTDSLAEALAEDFKVFTATNSVRAIEKIIIHEPDFVVIDARLPERSGYELCVSLRRNDYYRTTPILFLSTKASEREKQHCLKLGANDLLSKPLDPAVLRQKLLECARSKDFAARRKKTASEIRFPEP